MHHLAKNRVALITVVSAALLALAHLLYVQSGHAEFERGEGLSSSSRSANNAACVSHIERQDPWSAEEVVEPDALARSLSGTTKPIVLQVGIVHLYRLGHIPGSRYAGPASSAEGLDSIKKLVQDMPRNSEIVYYCGCCPWKDCPNIRPVHSALKEMGFKKIRVLNLPNNFSEDWAAKGLPTEKGGA